MDTSRVEHLVEQLVHVPHDGLGLLPHAGQGVPTLQHERVQLAQLGNIRPGQAVALQVLPGGVTRLHARQGCVAIATITKIASPIYVEQVLPHLSISHKVVANAQTSPAAVLASFPLETTAWSW